MNKSTICVSNEFKKKLDSLLLDDESYEDCIKRLIGGYEKTYDNINREQEAFTLTLENLDSEGEIVSRDYITITYRQLTDSNCGDIFSVKKPDSEFFINQKASVIYKDDSSALIKFIDEINTNSKKLEEFEIVAYHFL